MSLISSARVERFEIDDALETLKASTEIAKLLMLTPARMRERSIKAALVIVGMRNVVV